MKYEATLESVAIAADYLRAKGVSLPATAGSNGTTFLAVPFEALKGETLVAIEDPDDPDEGFIPQQGTETVFLVCASGLVFKMAHGQDCCEYVRLEEVVGDLTDLIGSPLLMAEKETNEEDPPEGWHDSFTWTFYKLATVKGYVTLRWLGESNGYYSEDVYFTCVGMVL